ncbi:MAG: mevalonate kinase [Bacteriovoracaceae bacterium]|jgi:mevalonate kinase|nr:mevalonate kinase [Bacteriovoracaceae bacterium]
MGDNFSSKILLFGEYSIIHNSDALAIPYELFEGKLNFSTEGDHPFKVKESNKELKNFLLYLYDIKEQIDSYIDLTSFEFDIEQGLYFKSSIPQGHGIGSSGALCAAIYDCYGKGQYRIDKIFSNQDIHQLKTIFGLLESYFHEKSSGIDPLISYLSRPLLIIGGKDFESPSPDLKSKGKGVIFLCDTGRSRRTGPLVNLFLEKCQNEKFLADFNDQYVPLNNICIQNFLKRESSELITNFKKLSEYQYKCFLPMIPKLIRKVWRQGIESDDYYLKLCGGGGGGFLLGMTTDFEKCKKYFTNFPIREVCQF